MHNVIDSSSLINAYRMDFSLENEHPFWDWLTSLGKDGTLTIPEAIYDELGNGNDALRSWLKSNKAIFFSPTQVAVNYIPKVLSQYGGDLSEITIERLHADPYVIAHALACGGRVICNETPKPNAVQPLNKKIPCICSCLGIECWSLSRFVWELK